jgi:hypothetical protein
MRRFLQIAFGAWFAVAMSMAQGCMTPPANAYTYSNPPPNNPSPSGPYATRAAGSSYPRSSGAAAYTPATDSHIDTHGYTADSAESKALTSYLTQHKLPLVGAQVLRGPDGQRAVVLYGFVGSDFGKSDAVAKTRRYLGDRSIAVENRIDVRPELLSANRPNNSSTGSYDNHAGASAYPGPQAYAEQQNPPAASQYQQFQNQGGAVSSMLPLIGLLGVLGMGLVGGGSGFSFGSGPYVGSPFGYSPYSSFGGGAYPGYPMATPFGASPSGVLPPGVPYTTAPFGAPYGTSPSFP